MHDIFVQNDGNICMFLNELFPFQKTYLEFYSIAIMFWSEMQSFRDISQ